VREAVAAHNSRLPPGMEKLTIFIWLSQQTRGREDHSRVMPSDRLGGGVCQSCKTVEAPL